jgi:diacylglycerol O-acyltransferase
MSAIHRVPVPDLCALWAEARSAPMNIALIGVLAASPGGGSGNPSEVLEQVRAIVGANLHRTPGLRRVLRTTGVGGGGPIWVDDPGFDVARQVVLASSRRLLPDEQSFLAWCAERSVIPLDRTRPLWRLDVIPELPEGRVGVLVVLHHVLADGLRGVQLISSLLDPAPRSAPQSHPPWRPEPPPPRAELVRQNLDRHVRALRQVRPSRALRSLRVLPALAREPAGRAPATFLAGSLRPGRRVVVLRFPLEEVRGRAHQHGCTINELLLAGVTAGLREVLLERGECREDLVLRASVPVGARSGREGGMFLAPLPVGVADPDVRLRMIVDATRQRKDRADEGVAPLVAMPASIARLGILWARHSASSHINLYVTNVPGPPGPLYLGTARLLDVVPVAPLVAGVRLSGTALSYDGQLVVSLLGDDGLDGLPALGEGVAATLSGLMSPVDIRVGEGSR